MNLRLELLTEPTLPRNGSDCLYRTWERLRVEVNSLQKLGRGARESARGAVDKSLCVGAEGINSPRRLNTGR